ncbi:hypothetical protein LEN26_003073 [Aphanomyces euteiches]|nr:hypothetical protein AeMF1_013977 [Aphanomyces euteiches]KAH9158287.1 hypothetical protein LEN26_003073 [Aphanomyces euteiches]KAH9168785.1 hypothetical protein AeNC1_017847 [Aphanomyces euteiches]
MQNLEERETTIQVDGVDFDAEDVTYWESMLHGATPSLIASNGFKILTDDTLSPSMQFDTSVDKLSLAAKHAGTTLATMTTFAWIATLRKFIRQNDIVMGLAQSNRYLQEEGIQRHVQFDVYQT